MPFVNNPYYAAFNMPQMPYSMPIWNNMFAQSMPYHVPNNVSNESLTDPIFQYSTPKIMVDLQSPKSSGGESVKSRKKVTRLDPRKLGYQNQLDLILLLCRETEGIYGTWIVVVQDT